MKKTILVAGGAGFIGSHLCERLVADSDNEVLCVDNLQTGSMLNIESVSRKKNFAFLEWDIAHELPMRFQLVDEIYNLACPASPKHYQADPIATTRTSVLGTMNLLDIAKWRRAKIIQASTSEVYGDPSVHPQPETYWGNVNPCGVRSCYDEGKRCAESLVADYRRIFGVDTKIVRIFNTYGPRMAENDGRVVSNFIVQALRGENITIYGDGSQTRSFQYVDDLLDGMMAMMASREAGPVNIGNPGEFTIKELAEKVIRKIGSKSSVVFLPLPSDDPHQRKPDISLAKRVLGWEPSVQLDKGLDMTITYFKIKLGL